MKIGQLFKVNDPEELNLLCLTKEVPNPDFIRVVNLQSETDSEDIEKDTLTVTVRVSQDNQFQEYAYVYLMDLMNWWAEGYIARLTPDVEAKMLLGDNKV